MISQDGYRPQMSSTFLKELVPDDSNDLEVATPDTGGKNIFIICMF
jgi:hypothetical protein